MINNKLEKDYLYSDGYYRQKSVEDAVKIVDKLLVQLINQWNLVRRETTLNEDDVAHEKIDALRDCLYYLTNNDVYNNNIEVREKIHEYYLYFEKYGELTEEELNKIKLEESEELIKFHNKLHRKKLGIRRAGRVILKERLYGQWAINFKKTFSIEKFRSRV